jgi:hypothetical protein
MGSLPIAHRARRTANRKIIGGSRRRRYTGVFPTRVSLLRWTLGFRPCSFGPIAQVSRDDRLHAFGCLPLYRHAVVPSGFRLQVSRSPWSRCLELQSTALTIDPMRDAAHLSMSSGFPVTPFLGRCVRPGVRRERPRGWMRPRTVSASRSSRTSSALGVEVTCLPSPCGRRSRPPTPTETPFAEGDRGGTPW